MIKIIYFASIRERLKCSDELISLPDDVSTAGELSLWLQQERGAEWENALSNPSTLMAVNQEMVSVDHQINDGDEIAFFPPVTGG